MYLLVLYILLPIRRWKQQREDARRDCIENPASQAQLLDTGAKPQHKAGLRGAGAAGEYAFGAHLYARNARVAPAGVRRQRGDARATAIKKLQIIRRACRVGIGIREATARSALLKRHRPRSRARNVSDHQCGIDPVNFSLRV